MNNKQPVALSNTPRCSIRVLSQGNNVVIAQGSGKGTPAKSNAPAAIAEPQPQAPHALRKTKFFRLDLVKDA